MLYLANVVQSSPDISATARITRTKNTKLTTGQSAKTIPIMAWI